MQDFPYDVWQVIASHIPERRLRALYGVNRPLFLASMDVRDPLVAKRVHLLALGPSLAEEVFEGWANTEKRLLRMRNARGYFKQGISSGDLIPEMINIVRGLNGITELTIYSLELHTLFPLIRASLDSSRTSLLKLKITLTYVFVLSLLPLELTLPSLHILIYILDSSPLRVLKHLAAFITTHANTLQSVALVLPMPLDLFDPLLEALSRIAHLRDLRLALPFQSIPAPKLRSLVESIGSGLQNLRLRTRYAPAEENNALSWIPFGTLTKLDLRYDMPVTYKDYDYETLLRFLNSQNTIKCLRLEVPLLDSHLLTQLASNFESLQWLYLTFWRVELHTEEKDREKVRANPIAYFRADLDEKELGKWTLRHLRMASPCFSRKFVKMYANSVAECLPKLESWTSFGRQQLS
ncbi:hypothetical protein K443DRAFT_133873 [Laccaria amethystina LaAM-08-1]|uniref:F-box domain-containing protein n=1 Tax=Laccaria amethystina LaAM-08-1 TaxID=1095629 RepID=A0A0C9X7L6_9AGAR|nr:hypothetical protein K443DRAFT_133873 [Laccaria amethystina LaAM-08-1]